MNFRQINAGRIGSIATARRRRIMSALRMAHRVLGIRRKRLGLGAPGVDGGTLVSGGLAIVAGLLAGSQASAQSVTIPQGNNPSIYGPNDGFQGGGVTYVNQPGYGNGYGGGSYKDPNKFIYIPAPNPPVNGTGATGASSDRPSSRPTLPILGIGGAGGAAGNANDNGTIPTRAEVTGIAGSKGGDDLTFSRFGGGGGGGGAGVFLNGGTHTTASQQKITGGVGGNGGDGHLEGGGGGGGGAGAIINNGTLTNAGGAVITGGAGGLAGSPTGSPYRTINAAGGDGVLVLGGSKFENQAGGTVTGGAGREDLVNAIGGSQGGAGVRISGNNGYVVNAGTIQAGKTFGTVTSTNAVDITGNHTTFEIQSGSKILASNETSSDSGSGKVVALPASINTTFALGGTTAGTLNAATIGTQYTGFDNIKKTGTSTWTVSGAPTGTEAAATPWVVDQGQLSLENGTISAETTVNNNGTLTVGQGGVISGASTVNSGGILDLTAASNQTIKSLSNAGLVATNLKGGSTGTTLTVIGDYTGNGGTVMLNTVLNGDDSSTDRLVVNGNTAGQSNVKINNVGGTGAPTVEGIRVIEVGGTSNGSFTLLGDYVHNGEQAVGDGLYAYKLYKNGVSNPSDGNWYLRSQLKPVDPVDPTNPPVDPVTPPVVPVKPESPLYQPGVSVYESYPQLLLGLNGLPTLQQRVGNRYWNNAGNRIVAEGADAIPTPYAPPEEAGAFIEQNGVWGRIEGAHGSIDPRSSTSGAQYDYDTFKLQAGLDGMLHENEAGRLIGGITVHYARGSADIRSPYDADNGGGEIRTDGYGFGGTLTWYGDNGFYLDAQGQVTWYDSDLGYDGGNGSLVNGNNGFGYAASLETGRRITLNQNWSLTPHAQLGYSSVDFDSFNDVFGARIGLDRGGSLQGRLGLTLDHQNSWYNDAGMIDRTNVYAIANLYYEFLEGAKADVNGTGFASGNERLWGGLGLGGSYNWNNDSYSIYGEGSINTSLTNFADSSSYKGTLGFRVKW